MKYLRLAKKYIFLFVGAVLFGLAAVKLSSANKKEREANDKIRDLSEDTIARVDKEVKANVDSYLEKQRKNKEAKANAKKRLDKIAEKSGSVKSLLDEYNSNRV